MRTLEVDPQGMSGVGKAASRESVSGEKMTELVVNLRFRNGLDGEKHEPPK